MHPHARLVLLVKMEETGLIDRLAIELCTNKYQGVVHPKGFQYLKQFRLEPFPIFTFEVQGVQIEKTVFMVQGENTTVVQYEMQSAGEARAVLLELRPLLAFRDYHSLTHENRAIDGTVSAKPGLSSISTYR